MNIIIKKINQLKPFQSKHNDLFFHTLKADGLGNIKPHDYQIYGIKWLTHAWDERKEDGVILGDEMGLGKTLQSVSFMLHLKESHSVSNPMLVLSPLSVIDGWKQEFLRSAPNMKILTYIGDKESREEKRKNISASYMTSNWKSKRAPFDVFLTSYELCLKDSTFLERFCWSVLIVDEAHRLKNSESLLHQSLKTLDIVFKVLLTGTPVQNNLKELYSLLSFTSPTIFSIEHCEDFVKHFSDISNGSSKLAGELHEILKPFLLRRTKNEVILDLPKKSEVILYTTLTSEQKKLYKAILTKDIGAFNQEHGEKTRLLNVLMQLRKCCNHPYIFPGKLIILDKLLKSLKQSGHKVLIFSQMTTMLDIVQDYLGYRGYTYERLDGSVRGEERFLAVNNFNKTDDTFIFLLSTKAGGQGINLMTADTVIFLDNDFNPQNDLQAAARAHRIGQKRPVKIIRLVSRNTVEEMILKRADNKLKLTNSVIEGGQFSSVRLDDISTELNNILKFGLDDLFNKDNDNEVEDIDLEKLVGKTVNKRWCDQRDDDADENNKVDEEDESETENNMYLFEGEDYSKIKSTQQDHDTFDKFVKAVTDAIQTERNLRKDSKPSFPLYLPDAVTRKRKVLTDDEKEELRAKREANKIKRLKLTEEKREEKLRKLREAYNYISRKIEIPDDDETDTESESSVEDVEETGTGEDAEERRRRQREIEYIVGDLTRPKIVDKRDHIIAHCVDDSGVWGRGGLFTAIEKTSSEPRKQYELAAKVKDLSVGDVHLVNFKAGTKTVPPLYVALIVAHTRDRNNQLSPMLMQHLSVGLEKLYHVAKETGASIHFPRIGYNTPNFNWYGTEKLIKKTLAQRKIKTFIYYYKRRQQLQTLQQQGPSSPNTTSLTSPKRSGEDDKTEEQSTANLGEIDDLADIFQNCTVFFHDIDDETELKNLSRYVIAYDGDVEKSMKSSVTHVVTSSLKDLPEDVLSTDNVKIVKKEWVMACVEAGKLLEESSFQAT